MHDLPRQKLTEIVAKYGRALCDDPRRCEALLRDFCGQYRGEIHALVGALKERVAADLLASKDTVPNEVLLARLTRRLCEHRALSQLAARWAVHSWALALGVLSSEELQSLAPSAEPDWGAWCQLRTFEGHTDSVGSVVFSPDGAILASGSGDRTIRLWRVSDGQSVRQLEGHTSSVWSVAFSPDGAALASGSEDKTVRLWRVSDGQSVRQLEGHTSSVWSVAFSPDGATLASGSSDKTIRLWRVADGQPLRTLEGHTDWVRSVAFSPDGATVASGSDDKTIRLWRVSDGKPLRTIPGHTDWVRTVAFSPDEPDGATVASGNDDKTICLWRVSDGNPRRTLQGHTHWVWSVAFNPDGATLASGSEDKTIRLWRVADGQPLRTLEHHFRPVRSVAFSPDGATLASGGQDNTIRLWGASANRETKPEPFRTESTEALRVGAPVHDLPRQKLGEIMATYGRSLCDDPRRCEGLLRDFCGQYRGEIHALVGALKERVAADLLASKDTLPHEVLLARLTRRLCDNLALSQEAARWAVESWGMALGVLSIEDLQEQSPPPPSPPDRGSASPNHGSQSGVPPLPAPSPPAQAAPPSAKAPSTPRSQSTQTSQQSSAAGTAPTSEPSAELTLFDLSIALAASLFLGPLLPLVALAWGCLSQLVGACAIENYIHRWVDYQFSAPLVWAIGAGLSGIAIGLIIFVWALCSDDDEGRGVALQTPIWSAFFTGLLTWWATWVSKGAYIQGITGWVNLHAMSFFPEWIRTRLEEMGLEVVVAWTLTASIPVLIAWIFVLFGFIAWLTQRMRTCFFGRQNAGK
jgi:WD40 repeat protein